MQTNTNTQKRIAYKILRELTHVLDALPKNVLQHVARGIAKEQKIPTKIMLKVMRRYSRLYRI